MAKKKKKQKKDYSFVSIHHRTRRMLTKLQESYDMQPSMVNLMHAIVEAEYNLRCKGKR